MTVTVISTSTLTQFDSFHALVFFKTKGNTNQKTPIRHFGWCLHTQISNMNEVPRQHILELEMHCARPCRLKNGSKRLFSLQTVLYCFSSKCWMDFFSFNNCDLKRNFNFSFSAFARPRELRFEANNSAFYLRIKIRDWTAASTNPIKKKPRSRPHQYRAPPVNKNYGGDLPEVTTETSPAKYDLAYMQDQQQTTRPFQRVTHLSPRFCLPRSFAFFSRSKEDAVIQLFV